MPLLNIYYKNSRFDSERNKIADLIYDSLREVLNVKEGAKFVYFHNFESDNCIIPKQLWGISYSEDFILIKITMNKGRTQLNKLQLYKKIVEELSNNLDVSTSDISICLIENEPENWSFGDGKMQFIE